MKKQLIRKKKFNTKQNQQENNFKKMKKDLYLKRSKYLIRNKKIKRGIFLRQPKFREIVFPFVLNYKLINEFLKR